MNGKIVEAAVVVLIVGAAAAFALVRMVRALRGKRPSCCGDDGEVKVNPTRCGGCTGCGG